MQKRSPVLTTQRLTLRAFEDHDLSRAAAIFRSPEVARTYMLPDFEDDAQVRHLFDRLSALSRAEGRFVYAVALDGTLIGFINDVSIDGDVIELGYAYHPDAWGHGYASEALAAVIAELFRMGFSRVRAGYFAQNIASGRVMAHCGMLPCEETAQIDYRGQTHLCRYFQIVRPQAQG